MGVPTGNDGVGEEFSTREQSAVQNLYAHCRRDKTRSLSVRAFVQVQHYEFTPFGKVSAIETVGNKVEFRYLPLK